MLSSDDWKQYIADCSIDYKSPDILGFTEIEILQFLYGTQMDNTVISWCHAFNPSSIRIHYGCITCDASIGRISIVLNENDIVKSIEQEVIVGGMAGWELEKITREKLAKELDKPWKII